MTSIIELYSSTEIARKVEQLAEDIAGKISGDVIVLGLLKGSFVFLADLVRALDRAGLPSQVEFMQISSYGNNMESSRDVRVISDIQVDLAGRQVLLVDDIIDTGHSILFVRNLLEARGAKKVWTCALLVKPDRHEVEYYADFTGFEVDDIFVVGYGIDYAEKYRHLPYIGYVK